MKDTLKSIVRSQNSETDSFLKAFRTKRLISTSGFSGEMIEAALIFTLDRPYDLLKLLRLELEQLEPLMNNPVYKHYTVPKKRGGHRDIYAPEKDLNLVLKKLNYALQSYYSMIKPAQATGFVRKRKDQAKESNIVENARFHVNRNFLLNIDLKDFFPSIKAYRVKKLFSDPEGPFGFSEPIANALALLTTIEGILPIGYPTSPVISNFLCLPLDQELVAYCTERNLNYSRYADDLSFSSDEPIQEDLVSDLIQLIQKHGFEINQEKLRQVNYNRRMVVTGLTVNTKVNVDRRLLKKIRAMLHDFRLRGPKEASLRHFMCEKISRDQDASYFIQKLNGYIQFVGQVRGKQDPVYLRFQMDFKEALARQQIRSFGSDVFPNNN